MSEVVKLFLNKGFLISPDFVGIENFKNEVFIERLDEFNKKEGPIVLNKDLFKVFSNGGISSELNWLEFERSKALHEKGKKNKIYDTFLEILNYSSDPKMQEKVSLVLEEVKKEEEKVIIEKQQENGNNVIILKSFKDDAKKRGVADFTNHFRVRYEGLRNLLMNRAELQNLTSISRIKGKEGREQVSLIGMVFDKRETKNGNILLVIEDLSGSINVLVNKDKSLFRAAKDICFDEVIGISGTVGDNILFANSLVFPDVPLTNPLKKSKDDVYAAVISDTQIGSKNFLHEEFLKFIKWINGEVGSDDQKEIAGKIKYLFVPGDVVDGVGVYPGQETQLDIIDVRDQYKKLAELLLMIRNDVKIILCPGQHDAVRVAEPQPIIGETYGGALYNLDNLYLVTNPSLIEVGTDVKFKVLMYHGASMHGIINSIDNLRMNRAHDYPTQIVKYMLKKRHLAPTHSLVTYTPLENEDALLIKEIPDIVATGDLHRPEISDYNGILLFSGSCWQSITPFEEKVGNNPDPCKVPILNLQTREVKMLDFSDVNELDNKENELGGEI